MVIQWLLNSSSALEYSTYFTGGILLISVVFRRGQIANHGGQKANHGGQIANLGGQITKANLKFFVPSGPLPSVLCHSKFFVALLLFPKVRFAQ
jgi:hypothetical protein